MIVLVLSTPRSGSHYYSESLLENYKDGIVTHEVLSRAAQGIYLKQNGHIEYSLKNYDQGCYYQDLVNGQLERVYKERPGLELFFNQFIESISTSDRAYIVHEHVSLLPDHWIEKLISAGNKVNYLVRDRKEQLASRLIAGFTGVYMLKDNYILCHGDFANMSQYQCPKFSESIASPDLIYQLIDIYKTADQKIQNFDVNIINYESIQQSGSAIKKLFTSSFSRLCSQDQKLIEGALLDCG